MRNLVGAVLQPTQKCCKRNSCKMCSRFNNCSPFNLQNSAGVVAAAIPMKSERITVP